MSTPENPLSSFRTYSYHHILMICDNVETATSVTNSDNMSKFIREPNIIETDSNLLIDSKTNGKYVILANGLSDARYNISSLKWESVTGQKGDNGSDNFTSMSTEGSLSIIEPKGLRFLNEVQDSYRLLNSDPTGCVWMIKTIFVGHNDNQKQFPSSYITNIRPLIFVVVDLTADFTIEGGFYNISFVNINNGSGKLPQTMKSAETIKLNLGSNSTLVSAIEKKLTKKINDNSTRYFESVKDTVDAIGMTPKKVIYKFVLDDIYTLPKYLVDDSQQQNKTDGTQESGCHLDFSKSITIENAIKMIMSHSSQVKKDAIGDSNGEKFGFKIRSILNSSKDKHEIIYFINRYKLVFSDIFSDASSTDQDTKKYIKDNTIEFDYIYTGKNVDILDFSMKMELGMVFFQTIISNNNLGTQSDTQSGNIKVINQSGRSTGEEVNIIDRDKPKKPILPIFFSTTMKNLDKSNSKNPKDSSEFQSLLNRHAALENINAKMKIHGNPNLLNSINKVPENYNKIDKVVSNEVDGTPAFPHWESVPALAKVNIFMPTVVDNEITGREKFWYDGLYYVFGVTNEFVGGLFTQELDMISIPNSINDESNETYTKDKTSIAESKSISNEVGNTTPLNVSKIKNFSKIKALAIAIGNIEGVDPNLILGLIKQESSFNPSALGPPTRFGTAEGLMQLLPSTAEEVGISKNDLFVPRQNILAGTRYLKKQLIAFEGNLTLALAAYNAGPGNVRKYNGVPPFPETEHYVLVVLENAKNFTDNLGIELKEETVLAAQQAIKTKIGSSVIIDDINKNSINDLLNIHNTKTKT